MTDTPEAGMRYWAECREFFRQFRQQYDTTGSIRCGINLGSDDFDNRIDSLTALDRDWHHVACTFDSTTRRSPWPTCSPRTISKTSAAYRTTKAATDFSSQKALVAERFQEVKRGPLPLLDTYRLGRCKRAATREYRQPAKKGLLGWA